MFGQGGITEIVLLGSPAYVLPNHILCDGHQHANFAYPNLSGRLNSQFGQPAAEHFCTPKLDAPFRGSNYYMRYAWGNEKTYMGNNTIGEITLIADIRQIDSPGWVNCPLMTSNGFPILEGILGDRFGPNYATPDLKPIIPSNSANGGILTYYIRGLKGAAGGQAQNYVGTMILSAVESAPNGDWLPCKGQQVKATDYPQLNVVISNFYGGDSTNIQLPNPTTPAGLTYYMCANGAYPTYVGWN